MKHLVGDEVFRERSQDLAKEEVLHAKELLLEGQKEVRIWTARRGVTVYTSVEQLNRDYPNVT